MHEEAYKQFIEFRRELLNDPNIPQDFKELIMESNKELERRAAEQDKYLKQNPDSVIWGYDTITFEPSYIKESLL
jgi:hypothetical protein